MVLLYSRNSRYTFFIAFHFLEYFNVSRGSSRRGRRRFFGACQRAPGPPIQAVLGMVR